MKITFAAVAAALVAPAILAAPASASTDTVKVKVAIDNCTNCTVMATWSKKATLNSKFKSAQKTLEADNDTVSFKVPKGYWLYFTVTSPDAQVDAASVLVTKYVGQKVGSSPTLKQARKGTNGAYFCTIAAKGTIEASAGTVKADGTKLLAVWATPQLKAEGKKLKGKDSIKGVYGTQNTLPCQ
ncbi:MAG: hypothetical protein MUD05_02000 [Candidatus Nanopelagicales bacterium]|nr:hypothetical protein [Candidatus Nanopelagicales bacterium]